MNDNTRIELEALKVEAMRVNYLNSANISVDKASALQGIADRIRALEDFPQGEFTEEDMLNLAEYVNDMTSIHPDIEMARCEGADFITKLREEKRGGV